MSNLTTTIIKGVITGSCMYASDEMVHSIADKNCTKKNNILLTIAGVSVGFVVGKEIADEVIWAISDAIAAYGKEKD